MDNVSTKQQPSVDLTGLTDDLVKTIADSIDLHCCIQDGSNQTARVDREHTGEDTAETDKQPSPQELRKELSNFVNSHEQAERVVARLILYNLGFSRSVFQNLPLRKKRAYKEEDKERKGTNEYAVPSPPPPPPPLPQSPPPPPPPASCQEDIIPNLSPVNWLSDSSWQAMTQNEKVNFLNHALRGMFHSPYITNQHKTIKSYPRYSLFRQSYVQFGDNKNGIDRVILGHGPRRVLVIVGVHGNEPCGVEAVRLILEKHALFLTTQTETVTTTKMTTNTTDTDISVNIDYLDAKSYLLSQSSSWVTPLESLFEDLTIEFVVGNPRALHQNKRYTRKNLNRLLDIHTLCDDESARQQGYEYELDRGRILAESIRQSDFVLDVHSCSSDVGPFALPSSCATSEILAEKLPVKYVVESLAHMTLEGGTTLDCALLHGIPAVCVECGMHSHPDVVARAAASISSFLMLQCGDQISHGIEESFNILGRFDDDEEEVCHEPVAGYNMDMKKLRHRPVVMRCIEAELVKEGFEWIREFPEFHFVRYGVPVFRDKKRGEVKCDMEGGAFLVMPAKTPVLGEEALFWAVPKNY